VLEARSAPFAYRDRSVGPNGQPYSEDRDMRLGFTAIKMATESRQYEAVVTKTEAILERMSGRPFSGPDDPAFLLCKPEVAERYRVFRAYLDVQRRKILGQPLGGSEEQAVTRQLEQFYEKWYPLGQF